MLLWNLKITEDKSGQELNLTFKFKSGNASDKQATILSAKDYRYIGTI